MKKVLYYCYIGIFMAVNLGMELGPNYIQKINAVLKFVFMEKKNVKGYSLNDSMGAR